MLVRKMKAERTFGARSAVVGALAFASLTGGSAISATPAEVDAEAVGMEADAALAALVEGNSKNGEAAALAGASLVVMRGGKVVYEGAAGCARFDAPDEPEKGEQQSCARPMRADTKARVASVSKVAVALAAARLADEGVLNLDADLAGLVDWLAPLDGRGLTLRRVLAHVAGVRDPAAYWVAAPATMSDAFPDPAALLAEGDGEETFAYANINYGIAAGAIETTTGERFDLAVRRLALAPLGLDAGFNWSGVSGKARSRAATIYRWDETAGVWLPQIDGGKDLRQRPPHFLASDDLDRAAYLKAYRPADNPTLFSPQGGLRASAEDIARLVAATTATPALATPVWRASSDRSNVAPGNEWAKAFAAGLEINEDDFAVAPGRTLIGHAGEAYGLYSGAWRVIDAPAFDGLLDADDDALIISFLVTGVKGEPAPGVGVAFHAPTEAMMRIGLNVADRLAGRPPTAAVANEEHPEARPFEQFRNANLDVDRALAAARADGKTVALVLGGNWCHDSRGLAGRLEQPRFQALLDRGFHLVYVDVGRRNRNLDVARRFGVDEVKGTPTVIFVSPNGETLNPGAVHDWRNAASRTVDETYAYFAKHAPKLEDSRSR